MFCQMFVKEKENLSFDFDFEENSKQNMNVGKTFFLNLWNKNANSCIQKLQIPSKFRIGTMFTNNKS